MKTTLSQQDYLVLLGLWTIAQERRKSLEDLTVLIAQVLDDEGPHFEAAEDLVWYSGHLDAWLRSAPEITIETGVLLP